MKDVRWHGSSRSNVEAFPNDARREAGYQIRQASGAYRIIYLTTIGDVVHVLHAFQKKTQARAKRDIDLAKARLRQIR